MICQLIALPGHKDTRLQGHLDTRGLIVDGKNLKQFIKEKQRISSRKARSALRLAHSSWSIDKKRKIALNNLFFSRTTQDLKQIISNSRKGYPYLPQQRDCGCIAIRIILSICSLSTHAHLNCNKYLYFTRHTICLGIP